MGVARRFFTSLWWYIYYTVTNLRGLLAILAFVLFLINLGRLIFYIILVKETYKRASLINLGSTAVVMVTSFPLWVGLKLQHYEMLIPWILATLLDEANHITWVVIYCDMYENDSMDMVDTSRQLDTYLAWHLTTALFGAIVLGIAVYYCYELYVMQIEADVDVLEGAYYPYRRYGIAFIHIANFVEENEVIIK